MVKIVLRVSNFNDIFGIILMINRIFVLFLAVLTINLVISGPVKAETKGFFGGWSAKHDQYRMAKKYNPYLENARHLQIPQWGHEDWYVEDWTSQTDGMTLIEGFYAADILRDQKAGHADLPILVVGPNFYRLSGFDKRRVATTVDTVYGMTERSENSSFMLEDWHTCLPIGTFDKHGLRLH